MATAAMRASGLIVNRSRRHASVQESANARESRPALPPGRLTARAGAANPTSPSRRRSAAARPSLRDDLFERGIIAEAPTASRISIPTSRPS